MRKPVPEEVIISRFWGKVCKTEGCWNWNGTMYPNGYGMFSYRRKLVLAHRLCWRILFGDIPIGLCVLHRCDNKRCVNPEHLFLGTMKDNVQDMMKKGRDRFGKTFLGEKNPKAKLTVRQVAKIRNSYSLLPPDRSKRGFGWARDVSKKYGISQAHVYYIVNRKNWKHI